MRTLEISRMGNSSVADQLFEMREWLLKAGIQPLNLEPTRILKARVGFRASFEGAEEAARFSHRFGIEGTGSPAN
jgi:hypothetical protein